MCHTSLAGSLLPTRIPLDLLRQLGVGNYKLRCIAHRLDHYHSHPIESHEADQQIRERDWCLRLQGREILNLDLGFGRGYVLGDVGVGCGVLRWKAE